MSIPASIASAGFLREPPVWMQVILWLCFLHFLIRALLPLLGRSQLVRAWLLCRLHHVPVSLLTLTAMAARGTPLSPVVKAYIVACEAGLETVSLENVETMAQAGADPACVVQALVMAREWNVDCQVEDVLAQAMLGKDPIAWVQRRRGKTSPV